jgi:Flp pilus assembly protein TadG
MRQACLRRRRRGATLVEFAVTGPIVLFLVFATIIGAVGVFRYQQVASMAREGARWASVHGLEYARDTNQPAATAEDVFNKAMLGGAVALDPDKLTYSVTWNTSNDPLSVHEDYERPIGNTVTVQVTYSWFPELYVAGPLTLTSTSTAQMLY